MTLILLSLVTACLLTLDQDAQRCCSMAAISGRASGRLTVPVLAYRGTGRLGCYRASERG